MTSLLSTPACPTVTARPLRVMWLLNHSAARRFEIPMLKTVGVDEIYLPKRYPDDPSFRSASIDWSEDASLTLPSADLQLLNAQDWYSGASTEAWAVANRHFDVVFFIVHSACLLKQIAHCFQGLAIWRAYGLQRPMTYDQILTHCENGVLRHAMDRLGSRFYFGEAYEHLGDAEPAYLKSRRVFLPLGMAPRQGAANWLGSLQQVLFVCPDIGINSYYRQVYERFKRDFGDLPHMIGGAQPVAVNDPCVLGFVDDVQHTRNMTQSRVMYYHSREPNHIHYHPFEAIRAGMPLLYMAGGLLDRMGGADLPGRCRSTAEARRKLRRILAGDQPLIDSIRNTQGRLLEGMRPDRCEPAWRHGFERLREDLAERRQEQRTRPQPLTRKRIAVCLPIVYQGGTLRGAQSIAHALQVGSRQAGEAADIVLLHPDTPDYTDEDFSALPPGIARRPFRWRVFDASEARRAMRYAGFAAWEPDADRFIVMDDGIRQLQDCDLWLFVSDRLSMPVLPLRPHVLMVYDYLQRYESVMPSGHDQPFLAAARRAAGLWVTSRFTYDDALQYAGVDPHRITQVPMLAADIRQHMTSIRAGNYFIWPTNPAAHKNHTHAAQALELYYDTLGGTLECWITGEGSQHLLKSELPHLRSMAKTFKRCKALRKRVRWKGCLSDRAYWRALAGARFLWHPTRLDNGSFNVVEAAQLHVPSLSSDYPAMREMEDQYGLGLCWMNADDPQEMAEQLLRMEREAGQRREALTTNDCLAGRRIEDLAGVYWREIRTCL